MRPEPKRKYNVHPVIRKYWNELYIEMLSNPMDRRTDIAFCKETGITGDALDQWKYRHRAEIFEEVARRRKQFTNELRAKAYKALTKMMDDDVSAVKLIFQLMGDLVEKSESKVEYMSQEDKVRRVNALLDNIAKKKEAWKTSEKKDVSEESNPGVPEQSQSGPSSVS